VASVTAGPHNAVTDVAGLLVGHHHRIGAGWATGVTVVVAPAGAVAGVDVRGGGPGTRETDLLDPAHLVQRVQAVCLAGGSAYGLAAADGVMRWLARRRMGYPVGASPHEVVPIVPAAVLFDLSVGEWGNTPDAEFGYAACAAASAGPVVEGCVGAGAGARAGSLKGGVGTASAVLEDGFTVGAVVAVNPVGEVIDPATGLPWAAGLGLDGEFRLHSSATPRDSAAPATRTGLNTTIGVVATDAALSKAECRRMATVAHDGLARAVRPAHSMFDGDTVFALATGARELPPESASAVPLGAGGSRPFALDRLCATGADVFARAVVRAVLAAHTVASIPAYRDVWPGPPVQ
jgi:L-aminopeptidase/D-esterase-like protein